MKKHSKQIRTIALAIFLTAAFYGCGKKSPQKDFVAKVNDVYLTKEQLAVMIDTNSASNFYRSEVIRNWINREVMYREAVKKGILKEDEFKKLINEAQRELASSLLVQKYYEEEKMNFEPKDVEDYYKQHQDDFKRFYDSYLINLIDFNDEDKAVQFRSTVLESDWEKALNVFKGDASIMRVSNNSLLYAYEIHPVSLSRIVTSLYPGEISIVISDDPGHFFIVQEIQKYAKGSIPPFNVIKPHVESRFIADRKDSLIQNYIKELYSNNDIEVRN